MNRGFYTIMAAQFLSSLADNALLIAAIALLREMGAASWMTPMLKLFFVISYVLLAAFVGAFADSFPRAGSCSMTNTIKIGGCMLMFIGVHPLLAYAVVGFGAAAYSPAKYGIVTELLPPEQLVVANGWIEGLTVISIILGFLLGGMLISPNVAVWLLAFDMPLVDIEIDHPAESAIAVIAGIYVMAAFVNILIPDTGARYAKQHVHPWKLFVGFAHCCSVLWRDKLGQISLAVTTLFWGAGATLQFIVLKWAEQVLGLDLSRAAILQAIVAVGIAVGAVYAAARVSLKRSLGVLPVGVAMGVIVAIASLYSPAIVPDGAVQLGSLVGQLLPDHRVRHPGADRRTRRLLRRADERVAAAPWACAAVRRPLDRGTELQREPEHPGDAGPLRAADLAEPVDPGRDAAVRPVRRGLDGARDAAPSLQPAPVRLRGADRRSRGTSSPRDDLARKAQIRP